MPRRGQRGSHRHDKNIVPYINIFAMEKIPRKVKKYAIDSEHGQKPDNLRLNPSHS